MLTRFIFEISLGLLIIALKVIIFKAMSSIWGVHISYPVIIIR